MSPSHLAGLLAGDPGARLFEPFRDGVEICHLHRGGAAGRGAVALLRYAPGAAVPLHEHPDVETICVLAGSQSDERGTYRAGDVIVNPPGSRHRVWSAEGCLVLIAWAAPVRLLGDAETGPEPEPERLAIAVVGAHLSGMPLNGELLALGGRLLAETRTAPDYRLYALSGTVPPKPGLIREPGFAGPGLAVEVWSLDPASFGRFVAGIPQPLGIGKLRLADGSLVSGFLCEPAALAGAEDITHFGGWRAYMAFRRAETA